MKLKEMRSKSDTDLHKHATKLREKLAANKRNPETGEKNLFVARSLRREIAQVLTVANEPKSQDNKQEPPTEAVDKKEAKE